jgi:hypothetical protein
MSTLQTGRPPGIGLGSVLVHALNGSRPGLDLKNALTDNASEKLL